MPGQVAVVFHYERKIAAPHGARQSGQRQAGQIERGQFQMVSAPRNPASDHVGSHPRRCRPASCRARSGSAYRKCPRQNRRCGCSNCAPPDRSNWRVRERKPRRSPTAAADARSPPNCRPRIRCVPVAVALALRIPVHDPGSKPVRAMLDAHGAALRAQIEIAGRLGARDLRIQGAPLRAGFAALDAEALLDAQPTPVRGAGIDSHVVGVHALVADLLRAVVHHLECGSRPAIPGCHCVVSRPGAFRRAGSSARARNIRWASRSAMRPSPRRRSFAPGPPRGGSAVCHRSNATVVRRPSCRSTRVGSGSPVRPS